MNININQNNISFGSQYNISVNGIEKYYAETDFFTKKIIHLYLKKDLVERITIFKSFYWHTPNYKIELPNGLRHKFMTMSVWKTYFKCILDSDYYEVYCHRKRKISIYKNGTQIGSCEKDGVTILNGDNYKILADNDANAEILISFILILDNINSRTAGNLFTIDFGLIYKEYKKYNPFWKPK